jgi:hypothetical protein
MFKKLKSKMLTYLFTDWVKNEEDVETLLLTKQLIENRKNAIVGHTPVIGFRTNHKVDESIS